jgi:hypothetical protein
VPACEMAGLELPVETVSSLHGGHAPPVSNILTHDGCVPILAAVFYEDLGYYIL